MCVRSRVSSINEGMQEEWNEQLSERPSDKAPYMRTDGVDAVGEGTVESEDGTRADRPAGWGRPVLSFVRRWAVWTHGCSALWDRYAGEYLLDVNAGEGSLNVRPGVTIDGGYVCRTWGNGNPLIVENRYRAGREHRRRGRRAP